MTYSVVRSLAVYVEVLTTEKSVLSLDEAKILITYARCVIERSLGKGRICDEEECLEVVKSDHREKFLNFKFPVFISLEKIIQEGSSTKRVLRGSMGIPKPVVNLLNAVRYAAYYAAFCDPRRGPLRINELKNCVLELTILFEPRQLKLEEAVSMFMPGYHTLIIEMSAGDTIVILPHTQVELAEKLQREGLTGLSKKDFVEKLLEYKSINVREIASVYLYNTQIFYELYPQSIIIERKLYKNRVLKMLQEYSSTERVEHTDLGNERTRYI